MASVDITPQEPIWLAGYGNRTKPSEGVLQPIHAKALVLEDQTGSKTVLITSDLLGFVKEVSDPIAARVLKKYGIPRERLALNASHTHSAPVIGHMLRPAYPLNPEQEKVIDRYTARLEDQVVDVIGAAITNLAPADVAFSQGLAGVAVNRRRAVMSRALPGPVDQDVPVLSVRSPDGKLRRDRVRLRLPQHRPLRLRRSTAIGPASRRRRSKKRIPAPRPCSSRTAAPTQILCPAAPSTSPGNTVRSLPTPWKKRFAERCARRPVL